MDTTGKFFSRLTKLVVTLESETNKLQQAFENRNNEDDDSETTARAMRAYHELNCDVGNLKGQIQGQLVQQKAQENEVDRFIKACRLMEQKATQDIQTIKEHWEKYGYQAVQDTKRPSKAKCQESEAEHDVGDAHEPNSVDGQEESQEVAGGDSFSTPPKATNSSFSGVMQTPQLSDFGLSEMQLKRALAGAEWCAEVPLMPQLSLPQPTLCTPAPPPIPLTPRCALQMDDDKLQTPQMHDFGLSEHTMCLNNDFTMDLSRKNLTKQQRPSLDKPEPAVNSLMESLQTQANKLESPEPPVFSTLGLKIKKTNGPDTLVTQDNGDPESPACPYTLPTTPEVPEFKTPYMNRLVSNKKSARQIEPIHMQADDENHIFELQTTPLNRATCSKRSWEYSVPETSILDVEEKQMPEMPNLESLLGNTLQSRSAKMKKNTSEHKKATMEPTVNSLELDSPTQELSLCTPRTGVDYQEFSTPEMPDLSSVTQDICKLLSAAQPKKTVMAVVNPNVRPDDVKSSLLFNAASVTLVSESEFQSLPNYLRQMTLQKLNQAVRSINQYAGQKSEFQMEDLKRITNVGAKTPVYVLCLTELKRLKRMAGPSNTSVYRLSTPN